MHSTNENTNYTICVNYAW